MVEQAQGIQERKAHLEIYRPTHAPTAASQKTRCHKLREFTRT